MDAQGNDVETRSSSWESLCRKHAAVAVAAPVLDLEPQRKFHPELQKSMSFNKWKSEDDHPLVCDVPLPKSQSARSGSPTESQKEKLESLRAAVKHDLRRAIMRRSHSPDSVDMSAFVKKRGLPMIAAQDDESEDVTFRDALSPWQSGDGDSLMLSEDDLMLDVASDHLSMTDSDIGLTTAWSTQPLDAFDDGAQSKGHLRKLMNKTNDDQDYHYYSNKSFGVSGASFIAYSKISVPAPKSVSDVEYDEASSLQTRVTRGFVEAGKKVLGSVWTWAVMAVLIAGVKIRHSCVVSEDPVLPTNYWIESNKLEFDWDSDVEFKFRSERK